MTFELGHPRVQQARRSVYTSRAPIRRTRAMPIHEIRHPLVRHKIGLMREVDISTKKFRELTAELGRLLAYEACKDLELEKVTLQGWAGPVEVEQIKGKKVTVVPILQHAQAQGLRAIPKGEGV